MLKSLEHLDQVRQTLAAVTDQFSHFEAEALQAESEFPLFQRLALPIRSGKTRIPGIKTHDTRMIRLMEVLLHSGSQIRGWRSADLHRAILEAFRLPGERHTLTQLCVQQILGLLAA